MVLLLGFGIPMLALSQDDLGERAARYESAEARGEQIATRIGLATLGDAYLAMPEQEQTVTLDNGILRDLDYGLDPARKGGRNTTAGALYPLRKAMEQLAGYAIFPLLLFSVLYAMVRGGTATDDKLATVGKQFLTVLFLLWAYPLWDFVLYRGLAIPITETLSEGQVVQDVIGAIGSSTGREDLANGLENSSPTGELSAFYSNDLQCTLEIATGSAEDATVADACYGANVPESRAAMHARTADMYMDGSVEQKCAWLYEEINANVNSRVRSIKDWWVMARANWSGDGDCLEDPVGDVVQQVANFDPIGYVKDVLSNQILGWLVTLQTLLASVILWFVWVGVLVARAFSLTLAPIGIVWGLAPGGDDKPFRWFKGHAKIVFMPVGLAFGFLIFYAVQVAILGSPMMSGFVMGLAVRLMLLLGLITVAFKSSTLTHVLAGDVAEAAKDIGGSVRTRTIQAAGTMVRVGGKGAGMAAGMVPVVGGALQGRIDRASGKAASSMEQMDAASGGKATALGDTPSAMGERFRYGERGKTPGAATKAARAAVGGAKASAKGAKWAWDNRLRSSEVEAGGRTFARAAFVEPFSIAKQEIAEQRKRGTEGRTARTSEDAARLLEREARTREAREELRQETGMDIPGLRTGEESSVAQSIDAGGIPMTGRNAREVRQASALGTMLVDNIVLQGQDFRVEVEEGPHGRRYHPDEAAQASLTTLAGENAKFREMLVEEAKRAWGDDYEQHMVSTEYGSIPDVQALAGKSTTVANALASAAQVADRYQAELFRREQISHISRARSGSAIDRALRELHTGLTDKLEGETDEGYKARLQTKGREMVRMAWFLTAGEQEKQALGLDPNMTAEDAAREIKIDGQVDERWAAEGGWDELEPDEKRAVLESVATQGHRYLDLHDQRFVTSGGKVYGLRVEHMIKTSGERIYDFEQGSIMDRVVQQYGLEDDRSGRAYELAIQQARKEYGEELKQQAGESDSEYADRIREQVHRYAFLSEAGIQGGS